MSTEPLVLVADDEIRITKLVELALSDEGFRVVTAEGGREALRKAEEYRPDVIQGGFYGTLIGFGLGGVVVGLDHMLKGFSLRAFSVLGIFLAAFSTM